MSIDNDYNQMSRRNKQAKASKWDEAISDARRKIAGLRFTIKTYERMKKAGRAVAWSPRIGQKGASQWLGEEPALNERVTRSDDIGDVFNRGRAPGWLWHGWYGDGRAEQHLESELLLNRHRTSGKRRGAPEAKSGRADGRGDKLGEWRF